MRRRIPYCILLLIFILSSSSFAQQPDSVRKYVPLFPQEENELGLIAGISQFDNTFFELGISKLHYRSNGCAFGTDVNGMTLSAEYNPFGKRGGLMFTAWTSGMTLIMFGINLNSYTDFEQYNFGIKPMIGLGNGYFQLLYGYNFQIVNHHLDGINKHCFSLRFHIRLFDLPDKKG